MKNITYRNKNITIFLLLIIFIILNTGKSKAVLQANDNTAATYNLSAWMLNVRKMEELGGAMGLSESVSTENLTSTSSNNIDVHMEKNSEYGALVILSASSYGKPDKVDNDQTTTGNATGVLMKINSEWVAAGATTYATNYAKAKARYKDVYTTSPTSKPGDALIETKSWHGAESGWLSYNNEMGFIRARVNSIFSYTGSNLTGNPSTSPTNIGMLHPTRAVVVSGEGL